MMNDLEILWLLLTSADYGWMIVTVLLSIVCIGKELIDES